MPNEIRRAIVEYGQSTSRLRAIFNVTSGNFLEQYDFFLFGLYAKAIGETFSILIAAMAH